AAVERSDPDAALASQPCKLLRSYRHIDNKHCPETLPGEHAAKSVAPVSSSATAANTGFTETSGAIRQFGRWRVGVRGRREKNRDWRVLQSPRPKRLPRKESFRRRSRRDCAAAPRGFARRAALLPVRAEDRRADNSRQPAGKAAAWRNPA